MGGPYVSLIDCVKKSGICDPNTAVTGTIPTPGGAQSPSYDSTCPADIPVEYQAMGATGNQCVTLQIIGEPCSASPSVSELAAYPCPNPSSTGQSWVGVQSALGDAMQNQLGDADWEWWMLVKKTATTATPCASGGRCELVFLRDSSTGYNCVEQAPSGSQVGTRGRSCVGSTAQADHANGWTGRWIASSKIPIYSPFGVSFARENLWLDKGHADRSYNAATGSNTYVGISGVPNYFARVGGTIGGAPTANLAQWPGFAGILSSAGGGVSWMQSYISTPGSAAVGIDAKVSSDWRIPANGACEPEDFGCTIGGTMAFSLQGGTTSVYRVCLVSCASAATGGVNGSYDPKKNQIAGWVGSYGMTEKSSATAGNTLTDSDAWHYCYVLISGECRSGSTAGQLYAAMPLLDVTRTTCIEGQISVRNACFFSTAAVFSQGVQMQLDNDPQGIWQRIVGRNLTRYGAAYSYSHLRALPNGKCMLGTAYQMGGWWSGTVQVCPGPFINDSQNRTEFVGVKVSGVFASGVVQFGYDSNFYCTPRAEACRVAASTINQTTPFYFQTESGITPVTGQATVEIPALPGRVLYWRILNGSTAGATHVVTVP